MRLYFNGDGSREESTHHCEWLEHAPLRKTAARKTAFLSSYERKPLLSAAVYIRHTSESLSSAPSTSFTSELYAFIANTLSLSLFSLYPYLRFFLDLFTHRCWLRARENPTHTLSAVTWAGDRILRCVTPAEETERISSRCDCEWRSDWSKSVTHNVVPS